MPFSQFYVPSLAQGSPALDSNLIGLEPLGNPLAGAVRGHLAMRFLGLAFFQSDLRTDMVRMTLNGYAMFGLPQPEVEEVPRGLFWSCYHPDDRLRAVERFTSDLRRDLGRDDYCERVRIIHQESGQVRWIEFIGQMFGPRAHRTHVIGILHDITDAVALGVSDLSRESSQPRQ